MHFKKLLVLIFITPFLFQGCSTSKDENHTTNIKFLDGEKWWAGVITDSHMMPFDNTTYKFDFYGNTAGNQGQPLLISNKGRYIWSDQPFKFQIEDRTVTLESRLDKIITGQSGETLNEVYRFINKKFFPPSGKIPDPKLFTHPQFNTWIEFTYDQNEKGIREYARKIIESGFPPGVIMIDEGWFNDYGNLDFDRSRFPDPKGMMDELHSLGFKVMLWVCPYISPDGPFFKELWIESGRTNQVVWIVNKENPQHPAIMYWWDGFSAVVDLTNPYGNKWYREQLNYLVKTYGVDGFNFDGGDASHYSQQRFLNPAKSYLESVTPNQHSEEFVKLGLDYPMNEYRAAWKMGGQPIAMRLRDKEHNWEDLRKLVPGIINQGLMGYPFSCPDLIGGGEFMSFRNLEKVDQELIVRAAQCHALMPMMQFSVAPWRVLDKENLSICVKVAQLHAEMGDEILQLAKESAESGEPIVRSLEYEFPDQGYIDIIDQFLMGKDILVAPVLEKGAISRVVTFPEGKWEDGEGNIITGPITKNVEAPLNKLPWYRKLN